MVKNIENYLETIKEHIEVCVSHLDDYNLKLSTGSLDNKDYFPMDRLSQVLIESLSG